MKNGGCGFLLMTMLLVFGVGVVIVAVSEALLSGIFTQSVRSTIGGTLLGLLMVAGLGWALYADSLKTRRALRTQPRPDVDEQGAVLYLRSFLSDEKSPQVLGKPTASFEEQLVMILSQVGPVIAVGEPNEELPPLGATRKYFTDDWQSAVERLIRSASAVVLRAGLTPGLRWELESVVRSLPPRRVLLALPYGRDADKQYREFARGAGGMFPRGLPAERDRAVWIRFGDDWTPHPIAIPRWKRILGQDARSRAGKTESLRPFCARLGVSLRRGTTIWTAVGSTLGRVLVGLLFAAILTDEGVRHDWHLQFRDATVVSERRTFAIVLPRRWDRMPELPTTQLPAAGDRVAVRKLKLGLQSYAVFAVFERIPTTDAQAVQEALRKSFAGRGAQIVHEEPGRLEAVHEGMHNVVLIVSRGSDVYTARLYGKPVLADTDHEAELKEMVTSIRSVWGGRAAAVRPPPSHFTAAQ